jgi:hypothetical protein
MKIKVGDLRQLIREEFLHGVPEWRLRQDVSDFVDVIKTRITDFVLINKSDNALDRQEAINAMNDVCVELDAKVYDVLEDQIWNFTRQV